MTRRPNILFVLTDQQLKRCLGFTGDPLARTPHLDRLADSAAVFQHAYTTCAACTPARASIQTGLYPFAHGMQTNLFMKGCMLHELADHPDLLPRRLRAAGYTPLLTGKWHLGYGPDARQDPYHQKHYREIDHHLHDIPLPAAYHHASGLPSDVGYVGDDFPGHGGGGHAYPQYQRYLQDRGLDYRVDAQGGIAEVLSPVESTIDHFLADRAVSLIDDHLDEDEPFFCMLNFWGPHEPAHVPTEFLDPFRDLDLDPWPSWDADLSRKPGIHHATRVQDASWPPFEHKLRYAYAYTSFIDHQIGRVLNHLRHRGTLDDTWVVFSADHGDSMGIHGGLTNKAFHFYEQAASVPLLIRPPAGLAAQRDVEALVNLTDVYETIADLAGAPAPATRRHGRTLRGWIDATPPHDWRDEAVAEGSGLMHCLMSQRMFRRGSWKYVFNAGDLDELYDLDDDPHEMRNLAAEPSPPQPPRIDATRPSSMDARPRRRTCRPVRRPSPHAPHPRLTMDPPNVRIRRPALAAAGTIDAPGRAGVVDPTTVAGFAAHRHADRVATRG